MADKIEHASIYAFLSLLLLRDWLRGRPGAWGAWLMVFLICAVYGFYLECLQALSGYRDFEMTDAIANTIGAAIGIVFWIGLSRRRHRNLNSA